MMPEVSAHDSEADRTGCELVRQRADTLLAEFAALMADVAADPDRPDLARRMSLLTAALREQRAWLAGHVLADEYAGAIEARAEARGYQRGLAAATAPGQRKGRHATQRSNVLLNVVRVLAPVAAGAGWLLRHAGRHPAAAVKASLAAHKVIAAASVSALAAGVPAAVLTVTALGPAATPPGAGSAGSQASVPGWHTSAVPFPDPSLIARNVTHTLSGHARKDSQELAPVPLAVITPSSAAPATPASSSPASSSAPPAGPPTLTVTAPDGQVLTSGDAAALDLSSGNPVTLTLNASGTGGWVSWRVRTYGTDLDFSSRGDILRGGQSDTLTVSVDPAQAADGDAQQVFYLDGVRITVNLPAPVVTPTPDPSDASTVVPSEIPTPGPS